jgi:aspartyl-tRNA(Asn)/glutamyl-tRNA(Gln) amidotransferase subunit A
VAYAGGLEQAGTFARTVEDTQLLFDVIKGKDENDPTTVQAPDKKPMKLDLKKLRIGRVKEIWEAAKDMETLEVYNKIFAGLERRGAKIVDVSVPYLKKCLPVYYIIATSEACSNMARFDGVRYGNAAEGAASLDELYKRTRTEYFGAEVKRRIMLGNYALSHYTKATRLRNSLCASMAEVFKQIDCVLMPTTFGPALELGKKITDPVQLYAEDLFTVPANILGVPAVSVPCGAAKNGLPIGLQIMVDKWNEGLMFELAGHLSITSY